MERFERTSVVPVAADAVFDWHARPGALHRLLPPWEDVRVLARRGGLEAGARVELSVPVGPLRLRWIAEHDRGEPGRLFRDRQVAGPFARWVHTHRFEPAASGGTAMTDEIEYALPLGAAGRMLAGGHVRAMLDRQFAYRHRTVREDLVRHGAAPPMRVLVSGSSGLVGTELVAFLSAGGHAVTRLVRREPAGPDEMRWSQGLAPSEEGFDAVVHLGGAGIADRRWTEARRREIVSSRVDSTAALARAIAAWPRRPRVFIVASGLGYYGTGHAGPVDERAPAGTGFLAEVARAWEEAARPAREAGIRVAHLRLGMVLTPRGGGLERMLPAFRWGLGGPLGSGDQPLGWIGIDDLLYAALHVLRDDGLEGPVNCVAPSIVTNREWTRALARAVRRPVGPPVPAFALRVLLGAMADELLLGGVAAVPGALAARGFRFAWPDLDRCLAHLLGRLEEPRVSDGVA